MTDEKQKPTDETLRERLAAFVACAQALQDLPTEEIEAVLETLQAHFGLS
jgi:hypothetical protein